MILKMIHIFEGQVAYGMEAEFCVLRIAYS